MADTAKVLDMIKENDAKYVDFRFTDPRGKWQHLAHHVRTITDEFLNDGVPFDGSSIAGWKAINESDMLLVPDCSTAVLDPFAAQTSVIVFCDVHEPLTGQPYGRDPRSIAKKAEQYLVSTGIGDKAYFGPEAEFFIFDDVRYESSMNTASYSIDSEEGPYVTNKEYPDGNTGHRPPIKGGYFPVPPVDSQSDLRAEMLSVMHDMGLEVEKHHHEVAPSQAELGFLYSTLVSTADNMQIYKYVVHNVAHQYGKTATFMPKPIKGDNGSGMHTHQSIWKGERPAFAGNLYADLSETALYYIGGIIRHAKAINAFTNPTTNSYKRLIPGFEAPVLLAYSARNRSAACRIPIVTSPKAKRVEVRYPDPAANPYLAFAAMMMAGLDGVQNKIHPGDPMDKNLYDLPPEELKDIPTVCGSLRDALGELQSDHAFLLKGDVFDRDFIEAYIELKWEEVYNFEHTPHPVEFLMYYSV
ncbi:MAG TPA: type I glutamate--ammonia ligase [Stellaceae bacterium]|jgi:glutamine synthetase|nr:type I glutamate--ammonia ligase [Stellaceae bacterium]